MKRYLRWFGLIATMSIVLAVPAHAGTVAQSFTKVKASTSGDGLIISFVERGLQPGQNYAYTGSGTVRETFQCYRSQSFTPVPRKKSVTGQALPDPRAYQANPNGVVRGFIYLYPDIAWPDFCRRGQDVVPIHVCYAPYDLVDFVEPFDVFYFPDGTKVCGPIEPD